MSADDEPARTVVLGFDALDFEYLDRFSDSLPNFERLRARGVEAPLESTIPPWTGSAWPSMYTGTDPSHHGVFGFFRYDDYPDDGELVSRADVEAPALWNYLTSREIPSIVCNVPTTHPAEPIEGVLVPGYLASEDAPGTPEGIREELSEAIGEPYRIYSRGEMASDGEEKLAGYLDLIDQRRRAALALLADHEWRLALIQLQKTDAVFHNFDDERAHRAVYEAADAFLGSVLDAVGDETNVVVCSDHGMGSVDGYQIHLNEVLREHGYVEGTSDGDQVSLSGTKSSLLDGDETPDAGNGDSPDPALLHRAVGGLARLGVTPDRVYAAAERVGLEDTLVSVVPTSVGSAVAETVDWRVSDAYCRQACRIGVRLNLEGREPEGTVPASDYETVRSAVVDLLADLETPDGEPAFEAVEPRETYFDGPFTDRAPDVIAVPRGMNNTLSTALYGRQFVSVDAFDHQRTGVFLGAGPGFTGAAPAELSLTDVAPIAMGLLGLPIPARMTGQVPDGLLSVPVERESYDGVEYGTREVSASDDEEVTARLEDLGYL